MPKPSRRATRARHVLRRIRREAPLTPRGLGPSGRWWYRRYTPQICDFLLAHATEAELVDLPRTFDCLHELVGHAWVECDGPDPEGEAAAWSRVRGRDHVAVARVLSPRVPDPALHAGLIARFLEHLAANGLVPALAARRLTAEYRTAASPVAASASA